MKRKSDHELSDEQKLFVKKVVRDPVLFATHFLGVDLWPGESDILRSIKSSSKTAVRACHGVGKTFTLAVATLWWLARYPEGIVLTTAPTQRQVNTQLWSEIHRLADRSQILYPKLKKTELKFRDDKNFALGFSTNQAPNFQGYHGDRTLIIADEAPGIEPDVWDAVYGTMAGGKGHIVMAGNPTIPSGVFFDAFTKDRTLWKCLTIGAFDSPNLKGLSLEQLLSLDPAEGGPLDDNPFPHLVTKRWVYDQYQVWWHDNEGASPQWMARVMAQFPAQDEKALFRMSWLERAKQLALENPVVDDGSSSLVAGVDVGGGESETVVYVCEYTHGRARIISMGAWRGEDTRGRVVELLNRFRRRLRVVYVDAIGIGYNFALHLRDCRFPVEMVNVATACESKPHLRDNDPARRFVNRKACFYQNLADLIERGQVEGLVDETTIGQLAGILRELDSHGRMKIESKENARARGVPSPDRAEALMLALAKPPAEYAYRSIYDRPRRSDQASGSRHSEDPYDDDDDFPGGTWRARDWSGWAPGGLARYFRNRGTW